jgi:hypothetical protein
VPAADDWLEVHESALEQFARTSDARSQQLAQYVQEARQLAVSPDAFGHIPFIGARIYQAYSQHVTQAEDGLSSAAGVMALTSLVIRAAVTTYQKAEDHIRHLEHEIHLEHLRHLAYEASTGTEGPAPG